jgi:hypothetical protein
MQLNVAVLMLSTCGFQEGCSGSTSGDAGAAKGIRLQFVTFVEPSGLWSLQSTTPEIHELCHV